MLRIGDFDMEQTKQIVITSIDELLQEVKSITDREHKLYEVNREEQYRFCQIWYRGQAVSSWELIPKLERYISKNPYEHCEHYLTDNFYDLVKPILDNAPTKKDTTAWLSLAQHYGLPTRLLDWTISPLIALLFAIGNSLDKDGYVNKDDAAIWVLLPRHLNQSQIGFCSILSSDSPIINAMTGNAFSEIIHDKTIVVYRSKDGFSSTLDEIEIKGDDVKNKIVACHSVERNMRMYKQQSQFTVHNHIDKEYTRLNTVFNVNDEGENSLYKFIIPASHKKALCLDLQLLGITWSYVFPDMENIAKDVQQKYSWSGL
jgi:hypothetical protein